VMTNESGSAAPCAFALTVTLGNAAGDVMSRTVAGSLR
jgi:hypothetical protein